MHACTGNKFPLRFYDGMKQKGQFNFLLTYLTVAAKGCWKRSKSNSSYITPGGVTFHFDTHKLVRRLQENGRVYIIFLNT